MREPWKLVVQVAARGGLGAKLESELVAMAVELRARLGAGGRVGLLLRVADDPFASANPGMRGFDATLELRHPDAEPGERLIAAVAGLDARIGAVAHVDLCAALAGVDHRIVPCAVEPAVRYQYAMRRRADLTRAQYLAHYLGVHAEFGRRQPGVLGYTQFHVDPELSRRAARSAGLGVWAFDSISELHLDALRTFTDAIAQMPESAARAPLIDEENFVDRANSVSFVTRRIVS